jgi:translation elongation factor EF-Tu-like GTPase
MKNQATFKVEDVFVIPGKGILIAGKLIEGFLKKGMKSIINGKESELLLIEAEHKSIEFITNKQTSIGISLSNINKDDIQIGDNYIFI